MYLFLGRGWQERLTDYLWLVYFNLWMDNVLKPTIVGEQYVTFRSQSTG